MTTRANNMSNVNTFKKLFLALLSIVGLSLAGCSFPENENYDTKTVDILVDSEVLSMGAVLDMAADDLGLDIRLHEQGGTLEASQFLIMGNADHEYDGVMLSSNKYVNLTRGSERIYDETSLATTPVSLGVVPEKAQELGWIDSRPSWSEIIKAASDGELRFGTANPAKSFSGFSAMLSAATAISSDSGVALKEEDIANISQPLVSLYNNLSITASSSLKLANIYDTNIKTTDAIISYESVLHSMNRNEVAQWEIITPSDGVISADYPISKLKEPLSFTDSSRKIDSIIQWVEENQDVVAAYHLRPNNSKELIKDYMEKDMILELPFPGSISTINALNSLYYDRLRAPGSTIFLVDTSYAPREVMTKLNKMFIASMNKSSVGNNFREGENIVLMPFNEKVYHTTRETFSTKNEDKDSLSRLEEGIDGFADYSTAGKPAIYDALSEAYNEVERTDGNFVDIVLITHGYNVNGTNLAGFSRLYELLSDKQKSASLTIIADSSDGENHDMKLLSDITGGNLHHIKYYDDDSKNSNFGSDLSNAIESVRSSR